MGGLDPWISYRPWSVLKRRRVRWNKSSKVSRLRTGFFERIYCKTKYYSVKKKHGNYLELQLVAVSCMMGGDRSGRVVETHSSPLECCFRRWPPRACLVSL